jgi:hypothetical protein
MSVDNGTGVNKKEERKKEREKGERESERKSAQTFVEIKIKRGKKRTGHYHQRTFKHDQ